MSIIFRAKAKSHAGQGRRALSLFLCGLFFMAGGFLFAPVESVWAQSVNDVQARLSRVENEIQTLSRAMFRGEQPSQEFMAQSQSGAGASGGASSADIEVRLSQLEGDLRTLTGKVEEQSYRISQLQTKLDKNLSDMDMRIKAVEAQSHVAAPMADMNGSGASGTGGFGMRTVTPYAPAPSSPPSPVASPANAGGMAGGGNSASSGGVGTLGTLSQPPQGNGTNAVPAPSSAAGGAGASSTDVYGKAFATLQGGDYAGAAQAFEAFLAKYPDDPLAANAQYWLGESYYARQDYTQAARVFAEAYRKYPKSPKTQDNLLKLALSLAGQGNKNDACVALGQLRKEFPDGTGPVLTRAAEEQKKLSCP